MKDRSDRLVRKIVIVGGGTAGWMAAAALSHRLSGLGLDITLIESAEIGTVGVGEATLPQIRYFNQALGIDETELMAATSATIKLGIQFCDWGRIGDSYFHPFGAYGDTIGPADFHHYWVRQAGRSGCEPFGNFSFPIAAAEAGKFDLPGPQHEGGPTAYSYAFQFDASLYAAFLSRFATQRGVRRVEGKIVSAALDSESGFIRTVTLETGETFGADLFIDCSGFRGILIEQELKAGYEDWSEFLPNNRAYAVPCEMKGPLSPYTRATARTAGWQWRIPLQHRVGNGHVYCDRYISDQDALDQLMTTLEGAPLAEPKQLFFKTGKRRKMWSRNCVAIGLSGGFLEPLESTSIDLIQSGIDNLLALFPEKECSGSDAGEYNRLMDAEYARIRDFLMLHYVANQRDDSPMWRDFRESPMPDSLAAKIDAFKSRGLVPDFTQGLFLAPSWLSVFIGQNIMPEACDPRVDRMPEQEREAKLDHVSATIRSGVDAMRSHPQFIAESGAAFQPSNAGLHQ